jgi:hypothetical protein
VRAFDLAFRPHEANVLHGLSGTAIRLYDTKTPAQEGASSASALEDATVKYDVRNVSYKALLRYALRAAARRVRAKLAGKG